uniref:Polyadenylate-binding protein n=2 Tax=Pipistrellus kuhlii TaxID=59472 RepID=A0A7J7V636_PIPKU|nr:poly(A) binding protein cytoplasmic 3 [Pipistrellus kuhlii]
MATWQPEEENFSAPVFPTASLYVGDLHPEVTEAMLYEKFSAAGPILSVRVCRDTVSSRSLGYGYVNFLRLADAGHALSNMNFDAIHGKPVRIMWCQRDPSLRKSGVGNIFINHLDKAIGNRELYDLFAAFGSILSCKVACDENGSKGHGFVHFQMREAADKAIKDMNGTLVKGRRVFVGQFKTPDQREAERRAKVEEFTNVYVKNFGEGTDDQCLLRVFSKFGPITSAKVMTDESGRSKGFGFIRFERHADAKRAIEELNGKELLGKKMYVSRAQKKKEREAELKQQLEEMKQSRAPRCHGIRLYVKNMAEGIDDERFRKMFARFGTITSAKVLEGEHRKGCGFVCFSAPEEARKAVAEMNGRVLAAKPLYVTFAQYRQWRPAQPTGRSKKKAARAKAPRRSGAKPPRLAHLGRLVAAAPQAEDAAVAHGPASQAAQPAPSPRDSEVAATPPPIPNVPGDGDPASPGTEAPASAPLPQATPAQPQRAASVPMPTASPRPTPRSALQYQYNQGVCNPQQLGAQPLEKRPIARNQGSRCLIASTLASASPENQKKMLGEWLFPLIQALQPALARKVTGMLLEMDNSELLLLLEYPESLCAKVEEAVAVLEACQAQQAERKPLSAPPGFQL